MIKKAISSKKDLYYNTFNRSKNDDETKTLATADARSQKTNKTSSTVISKLQK